MVGEPPEAARKGRTGPIPSSCGGVSTLPFGGWKAPRLRAATSIPGASARGVDCEQRRPFSQAGVATVDTKDTDKILEAVKGMEARLLARIDGLLGAFRLHVNHRFARLEERFDHIGRHFEAPSRSLSRGPD